MPTLFVTLKKINFIYLLSPYFSFFRIISHYGFNQIINSLFLFKLANKSVLISQSSLIIIEILIFIL